MHAQFHQFYPIQRTHAASKPGLVHVRLVKALRYNSPMTNERKNVFQQASLWAKTKAFEHGMRKRMTYDEKEWRGPPMWKVPLPWEEPAFFTKSIAQEFATKWGVPIDEIEENTDVFFTPPEKMEWLRRQHAAGMNTGSVALRIIEAHPQSIGTTIDWFTGLDRANPAAAYDLLR